MKHLKEIDAFEKWRNNKSIVLGIDIDGVQNNFTQGFYDVYQNYFPDKPVERVANRWQFYDDLDFDGEDARVFFKRTKSETWDYSKPFDGVSKAMKHIYQWCKNNNITLKIITSQPTPEAKEGAIEWLKSVGVQYDDIVFTKGRLKFDFCDIMIDDSHKVLNVKPENKVSIKINRNWNTDIESDFDFDELKYISNSDLDNALELLYSLR